MILLVTAEDHFVPEKRYSLSQLRGAFAAGRAGGTDPACVKPPTPRREADNFIWFVADNFVSMGDRYGFDLAFSQTRPAGLSDDRYAREDVWFLFSLIWSRHKEAGLVRLMAVMDDLLEGNPDHDKAIEDLDQCREEYLSHATLIARSY